MLIATTTDRRYVELAGVLLASLSRNSGLPAPEAIVFGIGLTSTDKKRLSQSTSGGLRLSFIDLDARQVTALSQLLTVRHLTIAAYVKMLIPDLVPERRGRMVFLDCDIVVNKSLAPLAAMELAGRPVAAMRNGMPAKTIARANAGIGRPADAPYFNAGVLVIDLDEWRRRDIGSLAMEFARGRSGKIMFHDQDVLNRVIGDSWVDLAETWNQGLADLPLTACREAAILHYRGRVKPFHKEYDRAALAVYDEYRALTPWARARRIGSLERQLRKRSYPVQRTLQSLVARLVGKLGPGPL